MERFLQYLERHRLLLGLLAASACGAVIAVGSYPALQDPVESGQVLAGIVHSPADNPFSIYNVKLWSLLNQIAAVLLRAGMSEITASYVLEGATAAISFAALYLVVFAISGRALVALFTPLFMHYFSYAGIDIAYPIRLLGTSHTYGIFGLSYTLLVVGFLGVRWHRTGAFLAGLAPAFHPSLGAFCVVIAAAAVLLNRGVMKPEYGRLVRSFLFGAVLTLASFLLQRHLASAIVGTDPSRANVYLAAFLRNFDYHRSFSGWGHSGLLMGIVIAGIALASRRRYPVPPGANVVFSAIAASVGVTVIAAALADFVPFPGILKVLMPWRYMNFVNLCALPVLFGFLAAEFPGTPRLRGVLFLAIPALFVVWKLIPLSNLTFLSLALSTGVVLIAALPLADIPVVPFGRLSQWQNRTVAVLTAFLLMMTVLPSALSLGTRSEARVAEIFRVASGRPGMLLTAGDLHLIQLMTRRPVLMDGGGLDFFCYVPETGPRFNEIMKKVYGLDILETPPDEQKNKGKLTYFHQPLWEKRSYEEWRTIGGEFGVTDIFTPAEWDLQLPVLADDGNLRLYTIP